MKPHATPETVLEARHVHVTHPGTGPVVEDATFTIHAGDFVGIVGPNGGGKTSLLRALVGLNPHTGDVHWWGKPLRNADRARVAYVPQNVVHVDARFPALVEEVVLLGRVPRRRLLRPLRHHDHELAHQALRETGMEHYAHKRIGSLSGGQRQRVFLAKALAAQPDVLVLDEPTTGVDPAARTDFYSLLTHLNRSHNMTIILVSHDSHALYRTVNRLIAINRRLAFDGTPEAFEAQGGEHLAYGPPIQEQACRMDNPDTPTEGTHHARA